MKYLLKLFYRLLYYEFAWSYDLVSTLVSFGHWQEWTSVAVDYLEDGSLLELGFGPGHLQVKLADRFDQVFGVDLSPQMIRIGANRMQSAGLGPKLTRADIQTLPFGMDTFEQVVATFPTEVLFQGKTVKEIARILKPGGKLVVVPMVFITGNRMYHKLVAWLYKITGQTPAAEKVDEEIFKSIFNPHGFELSNHLVEGEIYTILVIEAKRKTKV